MKRLLLSNMKRYGTVGSTSQTVWNLQAAVLTRYWRRTVQLPDQGGL